MADPFTLGAIAIGSTVAGTVVGAEGKAQQATAQSNQYLYQSQIATYNKQVAEQNADYARWAGEQQAQMSGLKTAQEIGAQKARQGASNLDVNFGSAVQVRESMHEAGWEDQQVIRSNAAMRAYAFETEGVTQGIQAQLYQSAAADAKTAGDIGVASTILGGISSVSSKFLQGSNIGMFGSGSGSSIFGSTSGAAAP